ncbi:hypothetical protein C0Q70_07176 [Pomacea canaliculata]|uniref:Uncharacterized protein n=1 Tax=Pomacea canaliculata TaxID=400727 RepID=A0A2T7PEC5_POMCA|nr:hypothetical protein C0Q70_07176 [Pomacea canaliculata]
MNATCHLVTGEATASTYRCRVVVDAKHRSVLSIQDCRLEANRKVAGKVLHNVLPLIAGLHVPPLGVTRSSPPPFFYCRAAAPQKYFRLLTSVIEYANRNSFLVNSTLTGLPYSRSLLNHLRGVKRFQLSDHAQPPHMASHRPAKGWLALSCISFYLCTVAHLSVDSMLHVLSEDVGRRTTGVLSSLRWRRIESR